MRIRDKDKFLRLLRSWEGEGTEVDSVRLPRRLNSVEPQLHDICHLVTGRFGPPGVQAIAEHVAERIMRLDVLESDRNEVHTLAAEVHVLRALGCTREQEDKFLRTVTDNLLDQVPNLFNRVRARLSRLGSLADARRVVRYVQRHGE